MCGLAGLARREPGRVAVEMLDRMAAALRHRGPDGAGHYADHRVGLAHVRLSIIDVAGGAQPLGNEDGSVLIVYNGEVYNYLELQTELQAAGHRFRTRCDTEVLVHAYEQWGTAMLSRLNGQFAFAMYDARAGTVFLARDRFGVRPLFYSLVGGDLFFASEAKALFASGEVDAALDPIGLDQVFTFWAARPPRTVFRDVSSLEPGCFAVWQNGVLHHGRYYQLDYPEAREEPADALANLGGLLDDSVTLRLRSDVPVGGYLSGGLDSSIGCALAARGSPFSLRTFSVTFDDPQLDEREFQQLVARQLQSSHHIQTIGSHEVATVFPEVVRHAETPLVRTAPAPMYLLAKLARAHDIKVVLTGEGADELFAGYDIFREAKVRRFCARDPESRVRPQLHTRINAYLGRDLGRVGAFLGRFYARGLTETDDPLYSHRIRFANGARILRLFRPEFLQGYDAADAVDPLLGRLPPDFDRFGPLGQAQFLEVTTFLEGYLLHTQADRMLMGHSVEGRFPYLDYRVAEFAARLPARLRLTGLREKVGLRRAATTLVPQLDTRQKWPYRAPIAGPLLARTDGRLVELLEPARVEAAGILDPAAVAALLSKLRLRQRARVGENEEMALAAALSTMLLHDRFVANARAAAPLLPTKVVERPAGDAGASATVWVAG